MFTVIVIDNSPTVSHSTICWAKQIPRLLQNVDV
jgi:hypothetical protein